MQKHINKIYEYKLAGLMWHTYWTNILTYVGLTGYHSWQKMILLKETKDTCEFSKCSIDKFGVVPKMIMPDTSEMDIPSSKDLAQLMKMEYFKAFLINWHKHECVGRDMYVDIIKTCMNDDHVEFRLWMEELLKDSCSEIRMIEGEIAYCENVDWNFAHITQRQEEMRLYYKDRHNKICKYLTD